MKKLHFGRKLSLHRETVRQLDDSQMSKANGGLGPYTVGGRCSTNHILSIGPDTNPIWDRDCNGYPDVPQQ